MSKLTEFQQLKMQLSILPSGKIDLLFRHHENFTLMSYRHVKLLQHLIEIYPVERMKNHAVKTQTDFGKNIKTSSTVNRRNAGWENETNLIKLDHSGLQTQNQLQN